MKNLLKTSLLAVILLTSTVAFANYDDFSLKVKNGDEKSIVFLIEEAQDVNLSIHSLYDGVIYEQKIHAVRPLTKVYNLEAFPDGNYTVKIENDKKLIEYQVTIENGKTLVSDAVITEFFKPVLTKENNVITLNMDNAPSGPIEVKILNEYNEELYAKVFASKAKFMKKFNTEKSEAKELTFIVRAKDQEFIETLSIK
ncbi:hypothetical protein FA048_17745 [Pedobacter polaris]|uniref:Uncharacterized protein n=1 Tax=Pedobacter polaris TaxID=2571273 RepID=A0A4V5NZ46_9SPHI|nr:hypothetical protein [Pedobacter polaris]TKC05567.1 hypothetical protein FA048_17745 [Pedobacter polaris]